MSFTYQVDVARTTPAGIPYVEHVADYVILANAKEVQLPNGQVRYTDQQRYYVQHGKIYLNAGQEVAPDAAPTWFWEAYERLTPESRKAVGLSLPKDRIQTLGQVPADLLALLQSLPDELKAQLLGKPADCSENEAPKISSQYEDESSTPEAKIDASTDPRIKIWLCDACGEETLLRHKGVHMAAHARAAKRAQKVD
jgi:hypothetical protein